MTLERGLWGFNNEITFTCDAKGCGAELHTDEADFRSALDKMKADGWKAKNVGGDWEHFCGCDEPDEQDELEEDFPNG